MSPALYVHYRGTLVGTLSDEPLQFVYSRSWLNSERSFPISISMPLREEAFDDRAARALFFNLLPEADIRARLAQHLGISQGNDFELLTRIGGDCAGAITLSTTSKIRDEEGEYTPLPTAR